jgi:hypothetical protein
LRFAQVAQSCNTAHNTSLVDAARGSRINSASRSVNGCSVEILSISSSLGDSHVQLYAPYRAAGPSCTRSAAVSRIITTSTGELRHWTGSV